MRNIYIDFSVLAYRSLFQMKNTINDLGYDILRHVFIKNIMSNIREFKPDRVYIAVDVGSSWRKNLFSSYKGKRKENRDKQDIRWDEFYGICDKVTKELKENFPFYVVGIDTIEADDIIAHLVSNELEEVEKIMITTDKDYIQLLQYPNTKLFDPIRTKFLESVNPLHDLEIKICSGDKSDNIPSILPRWGEKTAEKKILSGELQTILEEKTAFGEPCEANKNYYLNKKLIDFRQIPKSIHKEIELFLENYELSSHKGLFKYFIKNSLSVLMDDITEIRKQLEKLS